MAATLGLGIATLDCQQSVSYRFQSQLDVRNSQGRSISRLCPAFPLPPVKQTRRNGGTDAAVAAGDGVGTLRLCGAARDDGRDVGEGAGAHRSGAQR